MAKGKKLESSQRGILFSTVSALEVSILILIVGAGTYKEPTSHHDVFSISILSGLIKEYIGEIGVFVFAVGFVAAALSSMLAVPLGAGLTVESVFSECDEERDDWEALNRDHEDVWNSAIDNKPILKVTAETENSRLIAAPSASENKTGLNDDPARKDDEEAGAEAGDAPLSSDEAKVPLKANEDGGVAMMEEGRRANKELPRPVYWAIISVMVLVATIVISLNGKSSFHLTHKVLVATD